MPAKGQKKILIEFVKGNEVTILSGNKRMVQLKKGVKTVFYSNPLTEFAFQNNKNNSVAFKIHSNAISGPIQMEIDSTSQASLAPVEVILSGPCVNKSCDIEHYKLNTIVSVYNQDIIYCELGNNRLKLTQTSADCNLTVEFYYPAGTLASYHQFPPNPEPNFYLNI